MSLTDKEKWNKKYQNNPIPDRPVKLVTDNAKLSNGTKALDIACGMGRNSIYLASLGFNVDALDISSVAIDTLKNLDRIHAKEVDFDIYRLNENSYNLIVCTFFLKRELFPQIIKALKKDGILIYETFVYHPDNEFTPSNRSFLLEEGELKASFFKDLEILYINEYWDELMRGGKSMKVSMVAKKLY